MSRPIDTLRLDRRPDRELARLFQAQVTRARRALDRPDDEAVHTARKAVKRARSILRLVRSTLRRDRYRQLDGALRAVGRRTGPVRDAAVAVALADRLSADATLDAALGARLRSAVADLQVRAHDALLADEGIETLQADLRAIVLTREDLADVGVLTLHDGLAGTYARGRERFSVALGAPREDALHAWRRQVKHHGVHVHLLSGAWPAPLRGTVRAIGDLSDALGDDHDLYELVRRAAEAGLPKADRRALRKALKGQHRALQATAWSLGARVYAEPPSALAARITAYLVAALADAFEAPLAPLPGWEMAAPRPRWRVGTAPMP